MKENLELSKKLEDIVKGIDVDEISIAIINLKTSRPEIAGCNMDKFIYPASIYKVFVATEILRQVNSGDRSLTDLVKVKDPNEVDMGSLRFFPISNNRDHRPLLRVGDNVSLDYLLDLMLTRSDNTAANVLLDIAVRENINVNIILANGWNGSEVTRKFLNRLREEKEYRVSKITLSNARHLAEFFYKVEMNKLVNPWVSNKLKGYMQRRSGLSRTGLRIPGFIDYYRKGGWLEINGYKWNFLRGIKSVYDRGYAIIRYNGDAGVVTGYNSHYVIALLTITKTKWPWVKFPVKRFSREVHALMES